MTTEFFRAMSVVGVGIMAIATVFARGIASLVGAESAGYTSQHAGIAQLVEHNLAKVGVAGSSPVSRSGSTTGERRLPRFAFGSFGPPGWRNWQTRET